MFVRKNSVFAKILMGLSTLTACMADGGDGAGEKPADGDGSGVGDLPSGDDKKGGEKPDSKAKEEKPDVNKNPLESYVGSKDVNPDQRPLKKFDRSAFRSKEEIDRFVSEAGKELIMTDEEIAAARKAEKEKKAADGKKDKESEGKDGTGDKEKKATDRDEKGKFKKGDKDEEKPIDDEASLEFFKTTGIDEKEFSALPEKIQEKLVEGYSKGFETTGKNSELETKHGELKSQLDNLVKDSVIAARLEEIASGKNFVARDLPVPTGEEIESLMEAAADKAGFQKALVEFMASKAADVISVERSVIESKARREKMESDAMAVISEMAQKEKRIGITESDLSKINKEHAEYEAWKGEKGLFNFFKKHKLSLVQIKEMGTEKLLAILAKDRGWDKERDQKVFQQGAKALLQKIRDAASKARTIDMGKKSAQPGADKNSRGYDRTSLVSEIAAGTSKNWERLMEQADHRGDAKAINELVAIREEAMAERRKQRQPSEV